MKKEQKNKAVTKKTLLSSIIVLIVCVAMLLGTTFAWFTDSVSNTGNRIQAGTLDIDLVMDKALNGAYVSISGPDDQGCIFKEADVAQDSNETLWEPGKTQWVALGVVNNGSLSAKYNIYVDVNDEGLCDDPTTEAVDSSLEYALLDGKKAADMTYASWAEIKAAASAAGDVVGGRQLAAPNGYLLAKDDASGKDKNYFVLAVHMKEDAGNVYQGKDAIIDVNVVATQLSYEKDGFNNELYDANATYPVLAPFIKESVEETGSFTKTDATNKYVKTNAEIKVEETDSVAKSVVPKDAQLFTGTGESKQPIVTADTREEFDQKLTRNIKTTGSTENSVTYDIGYVYTETVNQVSTSYDVSEFSKIVTNVIQLASGLQNVTVTHSHGGTPVAMTKLESYPATTPTDSTYYYDVATGKLYIWSKLYSEFTITYDYDFVASIGTTGYTSIKDAMEDANTGDKVLVLKDCTSTGLITVAEGKNFELNLNGHTVKTVGNKKGLWCEVYGALTVSGTGYLGDVTHEQTGYIFYAYGTLTLKGNIKYESGLEVVEVKAAGAKVYVKDGYYIGDTYDNRYWTFNKLDSVKDTSLIEVTGGSFENFNPAESKTENPYENWVKEGYMAFLSSEGKKQIWTVELCPEARIGSTKYEKLAQAVAAVKSGETIVLMKDIKDYVGIENILLKDFTVDSTTDCSTEKLENEPGGYKIIDTNTNLWYYYGGKAVCGGYDEKSGDPGFNSAELIIPEGVESTYGQKRFTNASNLTTVKFPSTMKSVGSKAFWNCINLESIMYKSGESYLTGLPQALTSLGSGAFQQCPKLCIDIVIPSTITAIPDQLFYESGITSIVIPEGVISIGKQALRTCENLTEITLPSTITTLGESVCRDCKNLVKMYFKFESSPNAFYEWSFTSTSTKYGNDKDRVVYVKNQAIADAMSSKFDSAAQQHYTIKNIDDNSIVYYPVN